MSLSILSEDNEWVPKHWRSQWRMAVLDVLISAPRERFHPSIWRFFSGMVSATERMCCWSMCTCMISLERFIQIHIDWYRYNTYIKAYIQSIMCLLCTLSVFTAVTSSLVRWRFTPPTRFRCLQSWIQTQQLGRDDVPSLDDLMMIMMMMMMMMMKMKYTNLSKTIHLSKTKSDWQLFEHDAAT